MATTITTIDGYYQRPSRKSFETSNSVDVTENIADERAEGQKESVLRFPSLFWAGVAAFACNAVLIAGIALSPEMKVGVYGEETATPVYVATGKPSPFTEMVSTSKPRPVKMAAKVRPIFVEAPVPETGVVASSYDPYAAAAPAVTDLSVPRTSQSAAAATATTVRGNDVYRQTEGFSEFRRVTAVSPEMNPAPARQQTANQSF